ncbi:MAG TPA: ATP-binding protein, partial [Caulobacteraceae bacterium]|nr:ATP-binding protein [Caulobacteraceae bacterium]
CRTSPAAPPIRLQLPADVPLVLSDGPRIRQVVRNLLSNACKYGGGSPVQVYLSVLPHEGALAVRIAVEDRGPGLRESDLPRLFEPFDRGGLEGGDGLGLGLAVSHRIAERLGGSLTARNGDEGGACFVLAFTAQPAEPAVPAPIAAKRVLLVEDVELSRRAIALLLRRLGHTVVEAASCAETRARADDAFDLILLDLGLPDGDGLDLIPELRRLRPETTLIVLTASASAGHAAEAVARGARRVLFKPVSAAELTSEIGAAFTTAADAGHDFAGELAALTTAARAQIQTQARTLLEEGRAGRLSALQAHRLAGLAAQFDAEAIAAAADRLESALAGGREPVAAALAQLETAVLGFEPGAHAAQAAL